MLGSTADSYSNADEPYRILSISGRGVRGIVGAYWAACMEDLVGSPLSKHVSMVAASGSGSIVAAAISLGIPMKEVVAWYEVRARRVYTVVRRAVNRAIPWSLARVTYDVSRLKVQLGELFGTATAAQFRVRPTLLVTSRLDSEAPLPIALQAAAGFAERKVHDLVALSFCDPWSFPAQKVDLATGDQVLVSNLVGNPVLSALCYGSGHRRTRIRVCSIGDGVIRSKHGSASRLTDAGALNWLPTVFDLLGDSPAQAADAIAESLVGVGGAMAATLVGVGGAFHAINVTLEPAQRRFDDASSTNIRALLDAAKTSAAAPDTQKALRSFFGPVTPDW